MSNHWHGEKTVQDKKPIMWDLSSLAVPGNGYGGCKPSLTWWVFCCKTFHVSTS